MIRCLELVLAVQITTLLCGYSSSAQSEPRVAVMDFKAKEGITQLEAESITGGVRAELFRLQKYDLLNREDMEAIASNYKIELRICEEDRCLLKLGTALGAQYIVAGDVGIVLDRLWINARMIDVSSDTLRNHSVASVRVAKADFDEGIRQTALQLGGTDRSPSSLATVAPQKQPDRLDLDIDAIKKVNVRALEPLYAVDDACNMGLSVTDVRLPSLCDVMMLGLGSRRYAICNSDGLRNVHWCTESLMKRGVACDGGITSDGKVLEEYGVYHSLASSDSNYIVERYQVTYRGSGISSHSLSMLDRSTGKSQEFASLLIYAIGGWSEDGKAFAYVEDATGYLVYPSRSEKNKLSLRKVRIGKVSDERHFRPCQLSPNGKLLASAKKGQILVTATDGSERNRVVYGAEPGSKETIWLLEWSPSGKSLACGTFDADADEFNFFALDFE